MRSKSLEQLESNFWGPPEFPSELVKNCHKYRKIPIKDLTTEQLRLLISQSIGVDHLITLGIEKLELNVLEEGDFYPGDLLNAISTLSAEFWDTHQVEFQDLKRIVSRNSDLIKNEFGVRGFDKLKDRLGMP